jgi:AAA15 family ATPase/GTPase
VEKITVKNFLTIKNADIEIKRINLFIGPQATGKSILAKLIYYFKSDFSSTFYDIASQRQGKRVFDKELLRRFEEIFPPSYWGNSSFSITYNNGDSFFATISRAQTSKSKKKVSISYSKQVITLLRNTTNKTTKALEEFKKPSSDSNKKFKRSRTERSVIYRTILDCINNSNYKFFLDRDVFIPASRSFFANIQKNIFSFLANNLYIDPFLKEFGSYYENAKWEYSSMKDTDTSDGGSKARLILQSIIRGEFIQEKEQDWILGDGRKVNLANASSGQQESTPMLLVLATLLSVEQINARGTVFIEEPEAHLFPKSQKSIMSLIGLIHNCNGDQFIITTHSPYMLTAANNLVLANDVYTKATSSDKELVNKIIEKTTHIRFEDISAYNFGIDGITNSIMDVEARLIGCSVIDEVSNEFSRDFDALMDIYCHG